MHIGLSLSLTGQTGAGVSGPSIVIDDSSIPEDASVGDLVGTLSVTNGSGTYAFTLTDDAGGLFALDGSDDTRLEVAAALTGALAAVNSITVEADNGVDDPISVNLNIETLFDYYVATTGSNSNPGTSAQPFLTVGKLATTLAASSAGARVSALVRAGTYGYAAGANSWIATVLASGVTANVYYETGCVFQGPNDGVTSASWADAAGGNVYELNFYGFGAKKGALAPRITGFDSGTGNGVGCNMSGGALFTVDNFQIDDCIDGWSVHGANSNMTVRNLVVTDCPKSALSHVNISGQVQAFDCDFTGKSGATLGIGKTGGDAGAATAHYERCRFIPIANLQSIDSGRTEFVDCELGTLTVSCSLTPSAATTSAFETCFLHAAFDQNRTITFDSCWGKLSMRHRNGGDISGNNCHWGGPAAGSVSGFVYANFNPGAGSPNSWVDTIIRGYATALGNGFDATHSQQFVDAPADFDEIFLFGNTTNIDADLAADDGFSAAFTNITTGTDPQTGDRSTTARASWALQPGSPCIGAGTAGGDIGFQL